MKVLLFICMMAAATFVGAAEKPAAAAPASASVKGEVLEVLDAGGFTYMRLKTRDGEVWASVAKSPVKVGANVTIENVMAMKDFKSKTLNRTFPVLLMGNLPGAKAAAPQAGGDAANPHAGGDVLNPHTGMAKTTVDTANIKVPKATGANAKTVAEVVTKGAELKDKPVLVRGKIVKYNAGIMDKNWVHLRDGTGSDADGSNDVLVTTKDTAKAGDIVTAKGVVRTDKDFGSGYSYKVLIEDATLQK
jgi:hypothetical protein